MSDVLFVVPVFERKISCECLGTLLLSTILKEKGLDVDIYRYYESEPEKGFDTFLLNSVNNILSKKAKIVSFYCRGDSYLANIMVAKKLKEARPDIPIVFGGPQADLASFETIREIPWVDYCCSGEGETTVYPLFGGLLKGEDVSAVAGLTYRNAEGEVVSNPKPELITDLDSLPFIDYTILPKDLFREMKENPTSISLDVGRGCPYNCAYCSTCFFWQRKFRLKSSERIIAEMKKLNEEFGITKFVLEHDLFTASKKRVFEFCKALKESGLDIRWACSSRADTIDKETIEEMASAGLERIYLGIETGSARMQGIINKHLDIQKTTETINHLADNNIKAIASFIYGFPEETEEDLEETLRMVYKLRTKGSVSFQFHLCSIFPGTEYYKKYKDEMVWAENFSDQTGNFGVEENLDFIREHEDLFPFYKEYRNELRSKFDGMNKTVLLFMEMHGYLNDLDPEMFEGKRLVDLYLDFRNATKDMFSNDISAKEYSERRVELYLKYISTIYSEEDTEKLREILTFKTDLQNIKESKQNTTDVKMYNVDINAVIKNKKLAEIEKRTSMVYINMTDNKVSCGVQYLG